MKAKMLKLAGVKSEKEFYEKFPTEEAFMKAHGKAFKKAQMGTKLQDKGQIKKLQQLTDFGNPPVAQDGMSDIGKYTQTVTKIPEIGNISGVYDRYDKLITGSTQAERDAIARQQAQAAAAAANNKGGGSGGGSGDLAKMAMQILPMVLEDGGGIPKYQFSGPNVNLNAGTYVPGQGVPPMQMYNPNNGGLPSNVFSVAYGTPQATIGGVPATVNQQNAGFNLGSSGNYQLPSNFLSQGYSGVGASGGGGGSDVIGKLGGPGGIFNTINAGIRLAQKFKEEKRQLKIAESQAKIAGLVRKAGSTLPEQVKRKYVRPEDMAFQPDQLFPSYGTGTNYLQAQDGAIVNQIGGTPSEIQNMYNPGTLYDNLGYEPLGESQVVKQYAYGGGIPRAQSGFETFMTGGGGDMLNQYAGAAVGNNAGADVGGMVGDAVGMIPGVGPLAKAIIKPLTTLAGGLLDQKPKRTARLRRQAQRDMQATALMEAGKNLQTQYSAFVKEGGLIPYAEDGWVSHDWQPQVIAYFGEHSMNDLMKADPTMNTLRTGGNIRQNYTYPTDQFVMGGDLKTHWGGYAEPISYNPNLPDGGEMVMFKGNSHEQSDGKGNTGIGITYGESPVEVEGGEPAIKLKDGSSGDSSMVVFGNLKIPKALLHELGDPNDPDIKKIADMKFKNAGAYIAKQQNKQNKIIDKATKLANEANDNSSFAKLMLSTAEAMMRGADSNLEKYADITNNMAIVQNAHNETSDELGLVADDLTKGKITFDKSKQGKAKWGAKMETAQKGKQISYSHNNPLNVHYGDFAKKYGATKGAPDAGGYVAQFPTLEAGIKAGMDLLFSGKNYKNLTLSQARNRWVTGNKDKHTKSTDAIVSSIGEDKKISALTPQERDTVFKQFAKWEGGQSYNLVSNLDLTSGSPAKSASSRQEPVSAQEKPVEEMSPLERWHKTSGWQSPIKDKSAGPPGKFLKTWSRAKGDPDLVIAGLIDLLQEKGYNYSPSDNKKESINVSFPQFGENSYKTIMDDSDIVKYMTDNGLTMVDAYNPDFAKDAGTKSNTIHFTFTTGTPTYDKFRVDARKKYRGTLRDLPADQRTSQTAASDAQAASEDQEFQPIRFDRSKMQDVTPPSDVDTTPTDLTSLERTSGALERPVDRMSSLPVASVPKMIPVPEGKRRKYGWEDFALAAASEFAPYLRPSNVEEIDPNQFSGEMLALATNQLEPVQAQLYQPMLQQPYDVSFQDQLNEITAQTRAAERQAKGNPELMASIVAGANQAKSRVLADQFRTNQGLKAGIYNANRQELNDAYLKNLAILDKQYERQAQAKSRTKEVAQAALSSISDKIARNKLENKTLQMYENLYNYRYDSKGRAINYNAPYQFNPYGSGASTAQSRGLAPGYEFTYDANGNIIGTRKSSKDDTAKNGANIKRNGNIVKAIKGL